MSITIEHVGSLTGRVFLISDQSSSKNWKGDEEALEGNSDYDALDEYLSYDEGDLTLFTKSSELSYYTYFAISSKIEVFRTLDGFIVCDGLFFNESLDYSIALEFNEYEKKDFKVVIHDKGVVVFDAALKGENLEAAPRLSDESTTHFISMSLIPGEYNVTRVESKLVMDGEEIILKGVRIEI